MDTGGLGWCRYVWKPLEQWRLEMAGDVLMAAVHSKFLSRKWNDSS